MASISGIQQRTKGMVLEDFQANETIAKAVLYDFMIIGEASRNIPLKFNPVTLKYLGSNGEYAECDGSRVFPSEPRENLENHSQ